jgi:hypothetical protein
MVLFLQADFGHVSFPDQFMSPKMVDLGTFPSTTVHGVSASNIIILDTKRIRIEQFNYDGLGPGKYVCSCSGRAN